MRCNANDAQRVLDLLANIYSRVVPYCTTTQALCPSCKLLQHQRHLQGSWFGCKYVLDGMLWRNNSSSLSKSQCFATPTTLKGFLIRLQICSGWHPIAQRLKFSVQAAMRCNTNDACRVLDLLENMYWMVPFSSSLSNRNVLQQCLQGS